MKTKKDASAASLTKLEKLLRNNIKNPSITWWETTSDDIRKRINDTSPLLSDDEVNKLWYLNELANTRKSYIEAFCKIKEHQYYQAWCDLEQIEISNARIKNNQFLRNKSYGVEWLSNTVSNWQSLYPYHLFMSPEMTIGRHECSICGQAIDPWSSCQHELGKVYRGKLCYHIAKDVNFHGISIVKDPVQKYSVPFTSDEEGNVIDQYDYSLVKFVAERLSSPFDNWDFRRTEAYHSHDLFSNHTPDDGCPCGSGRQYANCCLTKPGVIRPHISILFDKPPPSSLPNLALAGYGHRMKKMLHNDNIS